MSTQQDKYSMESLEHVEHEYEARFYSKFTKQSESSKSREIFKCTWERVRGNQAQETQGFVSRSSATSAKCLRLRWGSSNEPGLSRPLPSLHYLISSLSVAKSSHHKHPAASPQAWELNGQHLAANARVTNDPRAWWSLQVLKTRIYSLSTQIHSPNTKSHKS